MVAFGQFLEVFVSGLLAGVLYSLVALGFVLIFKASGVFNFAQGSMVLLAGLALVRSLDWLVAKGFPVWTAIVLGLLFAGVIMAITAFLVERYVLGPAGQPGRPDPVHVDHRRDLHDRGRRADAVRLRRLSAAAVSRRRLVLLREQFPGRHPGQQDRRLGRGDRGRAGRGAGAVLPADQNRARACAPSPTITPPRSRSAFRSTGSGSWSGSSPVSLRSSRRRCGGRSSACSSPSRSWRSRRCRF